MVKPQWVGLDRDQWGLDPGTWSVLAHLYPEADVPVLQLSINALKPLDYHVDLGARLAGLRQQGVMIVGSGNVVHNLGLIEWNRPDHGADWARRFDDAVVEQIGSDPQAILKIAEHRDYDQAVPIPDHFIPLLYLAGLAAEGGPARPLLRGYSLGSLSMTCYGIGTDVTVAGELDGSAELPAHVPADQTNV